MQIAKPSSVSSAFRELGFTLIELLVCVAIIALLLALLLPALAQARGKLVAAKCGSNLHSIFVAYAEFRSDGNPNMFISDSVTDPGSNYAYYWYQGHYLVDPNTNVPTTTKAPFLYDYYKKQDVCWCPEVASTYVPPAPLSGNGAGATLFAHGTSYSSLAFYSQNSANVGEISVSNMQAPADTIFLADGAVGMRLKSGYYNYYHGVCCAMPGEPSLLTPAMPGGNYTNSGTFACPSTNGPFGMGVHGRHNGKGNVGWYDGHVSLEPVYTNADLIAALGTSAPPALANNLISEHVGLVSPVTGDYATLFSQNPQAGYYYWCSKSAQH